jgi:transcriptional regulator with XRE-family HTH domain
MPTKIVLREWRKLRKLSQGQLADASGVRRSTISDIETGKASNPGLETLDALAAALKIDVMQLLDTSGRKR